MEVCMNIDFISSKPAFFPQPFFMGHSILVQVTVGIFFFPKSREFWMLVINLRLYVLDLHIVGVSGG